MKTIVSVFSDIRIILYIQVFMPTVSTFAIAELLTMNNIKLFGTTVQENIYNGMWNYGAALSLKMCIRDSNWYSGYSASSASHTCAYVHYFITRTLFIYMRV